MNNCFYSRWMSVALGTAAAVHLFLATVAMLAPAWLFASAERQSTGYLSWELMGMFVAIWGLGYAVAAFNPVRHWPMVVVGLCSKIAVAGVLAWAAAKGNLPTSPIVGLVAASEIALILPFTLILIAAYRQAIGPRRICAPEVQKLALRIRTQGGDTLESISRIQPVMLVFLRHSGCTFCREALHDLAQARAAIEAAGTRLILVHMSPAPQAARMLSRYRLGGVDHVSDQQRSLYRAFGLGRGHLWNLFGPRVWWRGFQAGILNRHGAGRPGGDGFQMPGVFVLFHGEVIRSYVHQDASDRPDYVAMARDESELLAPVRRR